MENFITFKLGWFIIYTGFCTALLFLSDSVQLYHYLGSFALVFDHLRSVISIPVHASPSDP